MNVLFMSWLACAGEHAHTIIPVNVFCPLFKHGCTQTFWPVCLPSCVLLTGWRMRLHVAAALSQSTNINIRWVALPNTPEEAVNVLHGLSRSFKQLARSLRHCPGQAWRGAALSSTMRPGVLVFQRLDSRQGQVLSALGGNGGAFSKENADACRRHFRGFGPPRKKK